jgi:hypothetical protein
MEVNEFVGIGSEFLGYRIEELIGRGGMGVVYRAFDLRLKRPVALKLVAPSLARDERFRERFVRESELAMSLEHPNVVPIYDAGEVEGRLYLAMRLVEGGDLGSLLKTEGALEPARAVAICAQVAAALDAAHERGLVHRDVKPSNVLLDGSEHVYLADFGLTRRLDDESRSRLDRSIGTPAYLAPEQLDGEPVGGSADVYALGCVLYECLTGEPVFPRDSRLAVAWAHLEEEPPRPSKQRPGLPSAIDAVIGQALAKQPEQRFASCAALVAAAQNALGLRRPAHRRGLALAAGTVAVAIAIAIAIAIAVGGGRRSAAPPRTHANTLVRIDPRTQPAQVQDVIPVAALPTAVAVSGPTVYVYSRTASSVSEVDAQTNRPRHQPVPVTRPADLPLMGPVLAADHYGAWVVGRSRRGGGVLTHVTPAYMSHKHFLGGNPVAVVTGLHAVWVLVDGARHDRLLRLDPATGRWRVQALLPASPHIDTLAFGFRHLWAVDSKTAILYRIDPGANSLDPVHHVSLGPQQRAGRPAALDGDIWVGVSGRGGSQTELVLPKQMLRVNDYNGGVDTGVGPDSAGAFGSVWAFTRANGTVDRWDPPNPARLGETPVTDQPSFDGSCMTSLTAGDGAVWVTLAPAFNSSCGFY